jgi:putative transcriptional regulator
MSKNRVFPGPSGLDAHSSNLLSVAVMDVFRFYRRRVRWPFRSLPPGAGSVGRTACILAVCIALVAAVMTTPDAQGANVRPFFLVATRDLVDPLFRESVILILPPTQIPLVAGLIINKPTTIPVRKLFPEARALKNQADNTYFGGPVDTTEPSLLIRTSQPFGKATPVFDDVRAITDPGSIADLLKDPRPAQDIRLFIGRAQWMTDQLHAEVLRGSWYVVPAKAEPVFSPDPKSVWRTLVERAQLQEVDATRFALPIAAADKLDPAIPDGTSLRLVGNFDWNR